VNIDGIDPTAPRPVPDLVPAGSVPGYEPGVTDDVRNRYGVLLDHAAERGLLAPAEYQARLAELADATSEEQLRRIVTELPAFAVAGAVGASERSSRSTGASAPRPAADPAALDSAMWANLTPPRPARSSGNPWVMLLLLVAVLLVAMVALALVAGHVAHTHHTGAGPVGGVLLSRLRP